MTQAGTIIGFVLLCVAAIAVLWLAVHAFILWPLEDRRSRRRAI